MEAGGRSAQAEWSDSEGANFQLAFMRVKSLHILLAGLSFSAAAYSGCSRIRGWRKTDSFSECGMCGRLNKAATSGLKW